MPQSKVLFVFLFGVSSVPLALSPTADEAMPPAILSITNLFLGTSLSPEIVSVADSTTRFMRRARTRKNTTSEGEGCV